MAGAARKTSTRERGTFRPVLVVGPLLAFGVLLALGRTMPAAAVLLVGGTLVAASWISPSFASWFEHVVGRFAHGLGVLLSVLLLAPLALFVIVPVGIVLRAVRWDPMMRGRRPGWERIGDDRTARRTFSIEPTTRSFRGRVHGFVTGTTTALLLFAVVVLGSYTFASLTGIGDLHAELALERVQTWVDERTGSSGSASSVESSEQAAATALEQGEAEPEEQGGAAIASYNLLAHQGDEWAQALFDESFDTAIYFDPLLTFRYGDQVGTHVNVQDGVRRSYVPTAIDDGEDPIRVWFFGASTLWGVGQRDEHTIPSEVARLAEGDDLLLEVSNLGASAYTNWQSSRALELRLLSQDAPDLVVFLDGVNEVPAYLWGSGSTTLGTLFDQGIEERLTRVEPEDSITLRPAPETEAHLSAAEATTAYLGPVRVTERLAEGHGFAILHFFQPSLHTLELSDAEEPVFDFIQTDRTSIETSREQIDQVRALLDDAVIDLGGALDDQDRPVLFDWAHTNEDGARATAEAMYEHLAPVLRRLQDQRS